LISFGGQKAKCQGQEITSYLSSEPHVLVILSHRLSSIYR